MHESGEERRDTALKKLFIAAAAAIALASSPAYGATVAAGWDLAQTISAGFFGQTWQGVPLGTWDFGNELGRGLGVQNVGNADTIFLRDPTVSAGAGSTVSTGLHIEAMRLETVTPVDLAGLGLDHYFIDAGAFGILNITFDGTGNAGTFTEAWSFSFLEVRKGAADGPITPLVQQSDFTSFFSGIWSRTPPAGALTIPGVNLFLSGVKSDNEDFWPTGITETDSIDGRDFVLNVNASRSATPVPLPGVFWQGLVLLGGLELGRRCAGRDAR